MIVLDSSALVAMVQGEADADRFYGLPRQDDRCIVSAVTLFETAIVLLRRRGAEGMRRLMEFLQEVQPAVHPFTSAMVADAIAAYERFGKGGGSKAQLNFGDGASCVLAKSLGAPLLFKGNDFAATDVTPCA